MLEAKPLTNKLVAVLNKKIEPGKLMNALAHISAGLTARHPDLEEIRFDTYIDKDGEEHGPVSDHPFIVLKAKNSNKIAALRQELISEGLTFVDFPSTMTVGTYAEQKERTRETPTEELEYYAICMFGPTEKLNELTKKFSLWS